MDLAHEGMTERIGAREDGQAEDRMDQPNGRNPGQGACEERSGAQTHPPLEPHAGAAPGSTWGPWAHLAVRSRR